MRNRNNVVLKIEADVLTGAGVKIGSDDMHVECYKENAEKNTGMSSCVYDTVR
jgi:hypothetical protein